MLGTQSYALSICRCKQKDVHPSGLTVYTKDGKCMHQCRCGSYNNCPASLMPGLSHVSQRELRPIDTMTDEMLEALWSLIRLPNVA